MADCFVVWLENWNNSYTSFVWSEKEREKKPQRQLCGIAQA